MPKHTAYERSHPHHGYGSTSHRWAAPTMCDMLVFPRPQITAHTITPPQSPERMSSMFDGLSMAEKVDREKERQEWQQYATERPNRMPSLSRKGSLANKSRARAVSVGDPGSGAGPSRRSSSKSKGKQKDKERDDAHRSAPPVVTSFAFANPHHRRSAAPGSGESHATEAEAYRRRHQHSKSTSDLMQPASSRSNPRVRIAPSSSTKRQHDRHQNNDDDDGGVIVIPAGYATSRSNPDFTKPLPPLPDEYRLKYNPSSPFKPFDRVGSFGVSTPAAKVDATSQPTQQKDDADPFIDHNAASPRVQRSDTTTSASARAMLAKQHQRAINKRAFNSPRPRQQRDSGPLTASTTSSFYSQASHRASAMSAVSPLRRMTAMEEAIGRSRAASYSPAQTQPAQAAASIPALGAPVDARSPQHETGSGRLDVTSPSASSSATPRARKLSLESQTPSPRPGQYDEFKVSTTSYLVTRVNSERETDQIQGLFFRTPREPQIMRFDSSMGRTVPVPMTMPVHPDQPNHGLGFELEEDRRQSASDDSTVEIATPTTMRAVKGGYAGYSMEPATAAIPESYSLELASPPPISAAFMAGSTDTSPASNQSLERPHDSGHSDDGEAPSLHACIQ